MAPLLAVLPWSLTDWAGCLCNWTDFSEDRPSAYSGHVRDTRSVEECAGHNVTKTLNLVHSTSVILPKEVKGFRESFGSETGIFVDLKRSVSSFHSTVH